MYAMYLSTRRAASVMYLAYALAGVAFLFFPSESMREESSLWAFIIWHIFLLLGSLIGLVGSIIRRPLLEATGLPLLGAAFLTYSTVLFVSATDRGSGVTAGIGLLILGSFFGALNRFVQVFRLIKIADEVEKKKVRRESKDV